MKTSKKQQMAPLLGLKTPFDEADGDGLMRRDRAAYQKVRGEAHREKHAKMPAKKHLQGQQMPTMKELTDYLNAQTGKVGKRELARAFGIKGDNRIELKRMVKDLKNQGVIETERHGRRIGAKGVLPERVVVEITGTDSMGDLIARPLEWVGDTPAPQIIITKDKLSPPAGIGDVVMAHIKNVGNRVYHGEATRRVTAGENHMVGVYENGFVMSVDKRLKQTFELVGAPEKLYNRDIVIVDIPPVRERRPSAKFVRKIGSMDSPFSATLISIYLYNLPVAFTQSAEKQADKATVPDVDKTRRDLRSIPFVTIDGADARDFDDAVFAEPDTDTSNKGGWHIMVAIADVAWYVRPGDALDMDARLRGNSVYFPDRVLPMLPEALSNNMCSLQPGKPRAAMVCEAWINKDGHKIRHEFHRALIQSARRLTYTEVQDALDEKTPIAGLENEIAHLNGAFQTLLKARRRRGVLEIDVPERQVVLNDAGQVIDIRRREMMPANKLIEEMMILANVAAAQTLEEKGMAAMYRVHDRPSAEKIETLNNYLNSIGYKTRLKETADPSDFNAILQKADGSGKDFAVNEFVLRSQSQARYDPDNIGHFGLALDKYAHFTSPIRRYADIMVHRALIKALKLGDGGLTAQEEAEFEEIARHISYTERQAASAEQDCVDRYVASYLADKIGAKFTARISSATSFGLFVRLDDYGADGLIPMSALPGDYYDYDDEAQQLVGRNSGRTFAVGDTLDVILKEAVPITGGLVFSILGSTHNGGIKRGTPRKKSMYKRQKKRKQTHAADFNGGTHHKSHKRKKR